jgi:Asp-tRNA(Asn)/Glu-tRNA(Gln) amidotransferase A subunit family amidase
MHDNPLRWRVRDLVDAYRRRELSPVEVTELALRRIDEADPILHAFLSRTDDLAMAQARHAESLYASGEYDGAGSLLGVPVAIKDAFDIAGHVTTLGSLLYRDNVAGQDSGVVRRLRAAGAVFIGKTNTAEFGQSATTDNLLRADCRNPWDPTRTSGGSSGGSAAAVAAGLTPLAVGSDGGGSIRIPASFTGVFGIKPTPRLCPDEGGFVAMAEFVAPGPLARYVDDARRMLGVLADTDFPRPESHGPLRIAYSPRLDGQPADTNIVEVLDATAKAAEELGHRVEQVEVPIDGWAEIFGPLVLADEAEHRMHLLDGTADQLTEYERRTLEAAAVLDPADVQRARTRLPQFRARLARFLVEYDLILTPATAVTAFPVGERPREIDGSRVSTLWGAFPFTSPFNVAGTPAASLPVGMVDGLPVGAQLVAAVGHERELLAAAEQLEGAVASGVRDPADVWASTANTTS